MIELLFYEQLLSFYEQLLLFYEQLLLFYEQLHAKAGTTRGLYWKFAFDICPQLRTSGPNVISYIYIYIYIYTHPTILPSAFRFHGNGETLTRRYIYIDRYFRLFSR